MSAAVTTQEAIDERLARLRERLACQQTRAPISTTPVVSQINSVPVHTHFPAPVHVPVAPTAVAADITTAETGDAHAGLDASSEALQKLGFKWVGGVADKVMLVIVLAIKAGRQDVTRTELRPLYNAHFGEDKSDGWISARVNMLLDQRRVFLRPQRRLCTVSKSGIAVGALYVVMRQEQIRW